MTLLFSGCSCCNQTAKPICCAAQTSGWRHQIACRLCMYYWPAASASSCCLLAVQLQPACRLCLLGVQLVVAYWMKYNIIALLSSIAYKAINYCCLNRVLLPNKVHRYCPKNYSNINMHPKQAREQRQLYEK